MNSAQGKPILVVQTAFLGDLILCNALLKEIRRQRPQSPIYLVTRQGFGTLMKALGLADEVREIEKGNGASYQTLVDEFKKLSFEWIFCPHPSLRSKLFVRKLSAEAKVGFRGPFWFLFFSKTVAKYDLPDALKQWALLSAVVPELRKPLGYVRHLSWNKKTQTGLLPSVPKEYSVECRSALLEMKMATVVAPHTWAFFPGSVWATKQWTEKGFLDLAKKLSEQGMQILWLGGPDEKGICQKLAEQMPSSRSLAGQTSLLETLVILSRCEGAVANDSGGQHLAAVAGIPILSVFGPTTLDAGFRPWTNLCGIAEKDDLFCRPCGRHGHRACPRGTHECMEHLPASEVYPVWESLSRSARLNLNQ